MIKKLRIVKFSDGNYGIRKFSISIPWFTYLDIKDFKSSRNEINWRVVLIPAYSSWCTESSIGVVYGIYNKLQHKKVKPSGMTEDEVNKELFTERLKGR